MIINELLLKRPVEPLAVGVHLGSLGKGVVVDQMESFQLFGKVLLELTAVVSEHEIDRIREGLDTEREEFGSRCRGMR